MSSQLPPTYPSPLPQDNTLRAITSETWQRSQQSRSFRLLRREGHLRDAGMRQQALPVAPHQLLAHLGLELDLDCLKIL